MNGCAPRPLPSSSCTPRREAAIANAYAPYSRFAVGAALQPAGGAEPITGVNVENASYGLTMCAERSALFAAVAMGHRRFEAIAVHADGGVVPAVRRVPAGAGRVRARTITVVYRRGGEVVAAALDELLPERFEL